MARPSASTSLVALTKNFTLPGSGRTMPKLRLAVLFSSCIALSGLTASPYPSTTGSYTVSWQPATNATYYVLQEKAGANWTTGITVTGTSSAFSNYSGGTYLYRVQACNSHGCSAFSATFTEVVSLTNAPGVPPTFATAPDPSLDGNFTASWGAVSGTGILYQLEKSRDGTNYSVTSLQGAISWPITGQPEGDYQYRVKACRSGICGAYATYPEMVRLTPVVPTGVVVTPNPSTGAFTLSWTASPTATYYYVFESQNGGAPSKLNPDQVQHALSLALTRGNGTYAYQIEACKASPTGGDRCSAMSTITAAGTETIQGSAIPPRPGSISVSPTTCTVTAGHTCGVSISWGSSTGAQSYQLHEHIEDVNHDSDYTYAPIAGATQGIGFTRGLAWGQNPTVYEYTVRACAGSGASLVCSEYRGPATFAVNGPNNQIDRPTIVGTAYDAFGRARNGDMSDIANGKLGELPTTLRGFTGHVHEDDLWLIHMGGRVYDYQLGRFLSVDPVIQSPANSQSLNPYSYILNNPLAGKDPTGYCSTGSHIGGDDDSNCDGLGVKVSQVGSPSVSAMRAASDHAASRAIMQSIFGNSSGADSMSSKGASSTPLNGQASSIGGQSGTVGTASATQESMWRLGYDAMSQGNWVERIGAGFGAAAGGLIGPFLGEDDYGNAHNPVTGEPIFAADAKSQRIATAGAVLLAPIQVTASAPRVIVQESAQDLIARVAQGHASQGIDYLRSLMKPRELASFNRNPAAGGRFMRQAVHRATDQTLSNEYNMRFLYRTQGPDFIDRMTGEQIELTTPGQVGAHMARPGYDGVTYSTYMLPTQ